METFVMLTRLTPGSLSSPQSFESLERQVVDRIRAECPDVEWLTSYATLGPYDYMDLFKARDTEAAMKVSAIVRTFGHAHTEVWAATEWGRFKDVIRELRAA